jgi:hypothetical protein
VSQERKGRCCLSECNADGNKSKNFPEKSGAAEKAMPKESFCELMKAAGKVQG